MLVVEVVVVIVLVVVVVLVFGVRLRGAGGRR